jgi:hypothetical protein
MFCSVAKFQFTRYAGILINVSIILLISLCLPEDVFFAGAAGADKFYATQKLSAVIWGFPGNCDIMGMTLVKSRVGYSYKLCLFQ